MANLQIHLIFPCPWYSIKVELKQFPGFAIDPLEVSLKVPSRLHGSAVGPYLCRGLENATHCIEIPFKAEEEFLSKYSIEAFPAGLGYWEADRRLKFL